MLRRSHCVVPVGYVPSSGSALTGSRSPRPAMISAVTFCTKSGASAGTGGRMSKVLVTVGGTFTSCNCARAASTAAKFFFTTDSPRLPKVFSIACLIAAIASSLGNTPLIAKKQVCITVLIRPPRPAPCATLRPSITYSLSWRSTMCRCV